MKRYISLGVIVVALVFGGCLISGQITFVEDIDINATTDTSIGREYVDLNLNSDYEEHKDDIVSVDALAVVAIIENNLTTSTSGELWFTADSTSYTDADDIRANAIRVMATPTIAGSATLTITWNDAFALMENEDAIIDEVLGDGKMTFYGIASTVPFDLDIQAQVAVTVTISK